MIQPAKEVTGRIIACATDGEIARAVAIIEARDREVVEACKAAFNKWLAERRVTKNSRKPFLASSANEYLAALDSILKP